MKKYLFSFGLIGLIGLGIGLYMYNKPHKDIKSSKVDFKIEANRLFAEFEENESNANTKLPRQISRNKKAQSEKLAKMKRAISV